nr:protein zinc induced facilitator-like 1-like isoform X2 [Tanacetum cinerariifolium]
MVRDFNIAEKEEDISYYAGFVGSAYMVGRAITSIFWGVVADRYGRKPVIILGTSTVVVFNTLFGFSVNYWMAIITRFLLGFLNGLLGPIKAYASELFREEHQALGLSGISTSWGIGLIIGPALGGFLAQPAEKFPGLVSSESLFGRFPYLLPCLVISIFALFVTIGAFWLPERAEEEARLLDSTVGCVVSLLPVAPSRAESELEASVEKLFDEGGSTKQGDSAAGGGHDAEIELVTAIEDTAAGNVTVKRPKRPCKKRPAATDASGSSHPPKKLQGDYGTSSERLVLAIPTLPFVTSSVSATPEREGDASLDSATGGSLRTIGLAVRFVISSDSSHHSSTNTSRAEVDSVMRSVVPPSVTTEAVITTSVANVPPVLVPRVANKVTPQVQQSIFHASSSADTIRPDDAGPSHLHGKEISMGSQEVDSRNLHNVFVPHRNIPNDALLDDLDTSREFIDHLDPLTEYSLSERKRLESECGRQVDLLKSRDKEIENPRAQLLLKEAEAAKAACLRVLVSTEAAAKVHVDELNVLKQKSDLELKDLNVAVSSLRSRNDGLMDQVHTLEITCSSLREHVSGYEHLKEQIEEFQDAQMKIVDDKVAKLDTDLLEMACHLEEKFYPHLLTTISGRSRAIEQGMQSGLAAGIDHGKEGRSLTDVAAYNPNAEADFNSALQKLHEVDFPLLAELKSRKDASVEDIMNLLRLEGPLADAPGMTDLSGQTLRQNGRLLWAFGLLYLTLPVHNLTGAANYEVVNADRQENSQGNVQGDVASYPTADFEKEELVITLERDQLN